MQLTDINPLTLPSLPLHERSQLPSVPGIYFVLDTFGQVQYIGRSINIRQRWISHHRYLELEGMEFVSIAWLELSDSSLLEDVESALIEYFSPFLNERPVYKFRPTVEVQHFLHCRLAVLMAEKDPQLSQRKLSEATGLSPHTIRPLLFNKFQRVDKGTVEKLCGYFNCTIADLFEMREVA